MRPVQALTLIGLGALACAAACDVTAQDLEVEVFAGGFATVNSFVFSDGKSLVVLDAQRKPNEAKKLAELIREKHLPLTHILISHGHTDHFTGMVVLHQEFPNARIVVANEAIKEDIKDYAIYMDTGGQTGAEPALERALRPKSADNPGGFDYENTIHVLTHNTLTLEGGSTLEITSDYSPAEAPHMATVYSKDLNALFLADFGYNKVHLWMGDDIQPGTHSRVASGAGTDQVAIRGTQSQGLPRARRTDRPYAPRRDDAVYR